MKAEVVVRRGRGLFFQGLMLLSGVCAVSLIFAGEVLAEGQLFLGDSSTKDLTRFDLNGENQSLVIDSIGSARFVSVDSAGEKMYWSEVNPPRILRSNLDGSDKETIVASRVKNPRGVYVDSNLGRIFWASSGTTAIQSANLDGSDVDDILATDLVTSAFGIFVHQASEQIYWTEPSTARIRRFNLDGSGVETVVNTGFGTKPYGLWIESYSQKLYWADFESGKIKRSNLDGSNIEDIIASGLEQPFGLSIDSANGKLYWSDAGTNKLQRSNLDGSDIEDLLTEADEITPEGISLDPAAGFAYWTDANGRSLKRAQLDGGNPETLLSSPTSGLDSLNVDAVEGKVYWIDNQTIRRANLDGTDIETIAAVDSIFAVYFDISLDTENRHLYWVMAVNFGAYELWRSDLNGDNAARISSAPVTPRALAVDSNGGKVYWTDRFGGLTSGQIRRSNLDGSEPEDLVAWLPDVGEIALDLANQRIYWVDPHEVKIKRASFDGSNIQDVVVSGERTLIADLTIDPFGEHLYWLSNSTFTASDNRLLRANFDGSNIVEIPSVELLGPTSLTYVAFDRELSIIGNSNVISNGDETPSLDDHTNFGGVLTGSDSETRTFTIRNDRTSTLDISEISIVGQDSGHFHIEGAIPSTVAAFEEAEFSITFQSSTTGVTLATVELTSNDSEQPEYRFQIQGELLLDTDSDGIPDVTDPDDDNDGLDDSTEEEFGSNPLDPDSDGDGIDDQTEYTLGTNPVSADSDGDGISDQDEINQGFNPIEADSDGDGIDDQDEIDLGSNPLAADTDGDGVNDGQEVTDGTNPNDGGSVVSILGNTFCSEWNGFLGGMWNIMEHVNLSTETRSGQSTIYDISGAGQSTVDFSVLAGAQTDILVHDMEGWEPQSYGRVCSSIAGEPGDIDGRMVYYKPVADSFDFAFAIPFENGLAGSQFVPFNTFQPSFDSADAENLVTNWIQVVNLDEIPQTGSLFYYAQDGSLLNSDTATLAPGERRDFSGHQFGRNLVGILEWRPESEIARFQMRNVRYLYNNPGSLERFDAAFQLSGVKGSGESLVVPVDTRDGSAILEIANVSGSEVWVSVTLNNSDGSEAHQESFSLPAYGSRHLIADDLLDQGQALIDSSTGESIAAVAMHYGRTETGGLEYLYGLQAAEPLGVVLRGSYNTFLSQGCELLLANKANEIQGASLSLTRFDGTTVLSGEELSIPANGLLQYNLCDQDTADTYGSLNLQLQTPNTIIAHVIRIGKDNAYRFPTPTRQ